jgi:hypothetical protein
MMTGRGSGQALDWLRRGAELFGAAGVHQAYGEFCQENQLIFQMPTVPGQLQPDLQVLVQQLNESSDDQPGGSSAYQTTPEIMAEITEGVHRMSTPEPDEHPLDGMSRIRAVIDSLPRISTSRNRYLEKDLEILFHDRFLVHAIARDPHAARQIHEATGVPMRTSHKWRDHLEVDATWRSWNHKVHHRAHRRKLNEVEEKLIEDALNERSACGEKIDRKLVQIVVRQIALETRGAGLTCVGHPGAT